MKNLSFIVLGIIAVVLIGMAVWQFMWMSDVVDNYGAERSHKRPEPKVSIEENTFQDKGANAVIPDRPAAQEPTVVQNRRANADSQGVAGISVIETQEVLPKQDSTIKETDRMLSAPTNNEEITISEHDRTISIKLKSDKPLPPQRQVITRPSVSQRKPIDIPIPSVRQHATSTPSY